MDLSQIQVSDGYNSSQTAYRTTFIRHCMVDPGKQAFPCECLTSKDFVQNACIFIISTAKSFKPHY